jgi:hypothetical protein
MTCWKPGMRSRSCTATQSARQTACPFSQGAVAEHLACVARVDIGAFIDAFRVSMLISALSSMLSAFQFDIGAFIDPLPSFNFISALSSFLRRLSTLISPLSSILSRFQFDTGAFIDPFRPFNFISAVSSILFRLSTWISVPSSRQAGWEPPNRPTANRPTFSR